MARPLSLVVTLPSWEEIIFGWELPRTRGEMTPLMRQIRTESPLF
jgi:hypothetical protein